MRESGRVLEGRNDGMWGLGGRGERRLMGLMNRANSMRQTKNNRAARRSSRLPSCVCVDPVLARCLLLFLPPCLSRSLAGAQPSPRERAVGSTPAHRSCVGRLRNEPGRRTKQQTKRFRGSDGRAVPSLAWLCPCINPNQGFHSFIRLARNRAYFTTPYSPLPLNPISPR